MLRDYFGGRSTSGPPGAAGARHLGTQCRRSPLSAAWSVNDDDEGTPGWSSKQPSDTNKVPTQNEPGKERIAPGIAQRAYIQNAGDDDAPGGLGDDTYVALVRGGRTGATSVGLAVDDDDEEEMRDWVDADLPWSAVELTEERPRIKYLAGTSQAKTAMSRRCSPATPAAKPNDTPRAFRPYPKWFRPVFSNPSPFVDAAESTPEVRKGSLSRVVSVELPVVDFPQQENHTASPPPPGQPDISEKSWDVVSEQWLRDPQYCAPSVLRADILRDDRFPPPQLSQTGSSTFLVRRTLRKLLPKQWNRDPVCEQVVEEWRTVELTNTGTRVSHRLDYTAVRLDSVSDDVWARGEMIEVERAKLPFWIPQVRTYSIVFESYVESQSHGTSKWKGTLAFDVLPLRDPLEPGEVNSQTHRLANLLCIMVRHSIGTERGYVKRVHHDLVVPKVIFQDKYRELKDKYGVWAKGDVWRQSGMKTDPAKHVFEDIGIASWLLCLWEAEGGNVALQDSESGTTPPYFLDLACGNGFLTYLLTMEGYRGLGIDQSKRAVWDAYPDKVKNSLRAETVDPRGLAEDGRIGGDWVGARWVIGNHADELTLWAPMIATLCGYQCGYVVIPCCFFELSGLRFTEMDHSKGRYETYLGRVKELSEETCGFVVEREYLRMPSTKNVCLLGRRRYYSPDDDSTHAQHVSKVVDLIRSTPFVPRISDSERTRLRQEKQRLMAQ
ncbi:DUF1613-domain-containing protein [Gonapodya prolifera JEL478]|uniref:tRNA (uracil-O(2)-)-methyltransferase n=1 Tax=Gonapodya prolifera (strain JEL478) TaxID=1344416 RepID=A0A138ZXG9_GONPJ|nr:DUF1613-domain-containing protein [Gonapodya prolifera JEL478]|eukprot:KXS09154.1 DUF1613-domain-containing protein [Gonapodya prolifera JEL478]